MKKLIIIFVLLFAFLSGCESILDEEPKNIIDPERFYRTETDGIAAIAGIYSHLLHGDAFGIQIDIYFGVNHDLISPTRALGAGQEFFAYNWDENTPRVRVVWQRLYRAINDANLLIRDIPNADFDEQARNEIVAEGVFLRAFIYYYLTAMFGDVPYITEPTDSDSFGQNSGASRTPANEIRQRIIDDLVAIEDDLPTAHRSDFPQRATQWAAKTLKLKTYLWLEDYTNAKATAQDIVNNSSHRLLSNYGDIFREDNEFNDEIIFTLDHLFDEVSTNRHSRFTPRGQDDGLSNPQIPAFFNGFGFFTLYKSFSTSYAPNDLRRSSNVFDSLDEGTPLKYAYIPKQWRINDARNNSGLNYKFYRFADVLLNLAEAENELNGPSELAYDAINQVRARAGLDPLDGLTQTDLRQAIQQERAWELVSEGNHRKMDLLRWGMLEQALQDRLVMEQADTTSVPNLRNNIQLTVNNFASYKVLLPIPSDERLLNNNLSQNEGYN